LALVVPPKREFRSDEDQLEIEGGFIQDKLKTSRRVLGSLRGLIESFFDNPTFSF
jgi:hypothetical protein